MYYSSRLLTNIRGWLIPVVIVGVVLVQVPAPVCGQSNPDATTEPSMARISNQYGTLVIYEEGNTTVSGGVASNLVVFTDPDGHTISMTFTTEGDSDPAISMKAVLPGGIMSTHLSADGIAQLTMTPTGDTGSSFGAQFPANDQGAVQAIVSSDEYLYSKGLIMTAETLSTLESMNEFFESEGITSDNVEPASPWEGGNRMNLPCRNAMLGAVAAYLAMLLACVTPAVILAGPCAVAIAFFFEEITAVAANC